MQEFYLHEKMHGEVLLELQRRVDEALSNTAIVSTVGTNPRAGEGALRLELKLDGKLFPVRKDENPFSSFFLNRKSREILDKYPTAKFELEKNKVRKSQ